MSDVNAAGSEQDTAGPRHQRTPGCQWCKRQLLRRVRQASRNALAGFEKSFAGGGAACDGACESRSRVASRVVHQADGDFGARGVGNYVGSATAGDYADIQSAAAEEFVLRQRNFADFLEGVEKLVNRGFAEFGIRGMGEAAGGFDFIAQDTFRGENQLVFGGLAVDQETRTARIARGGVGAGAVAFFADYEEQAEISRAVARAIFRPRRSWRR